MKGAVAEECCRRAVSLVMRNNICITVAFAESYQRTDITRNRFTYCVLIFDSRAIGYFLF